MHNAVSYYLKFDPLIKTTIKVIQKVTQLVKHKKEIDKMLEHKFQQWSSPWSLPVHTSPSSSHTLGDFGQQLSEEMVDYGFPTMEYVLFLH